ncbi:hypothetical protein FA13DRAFT_1772081 [Coprinellus micaceus]|uniref:Uncharacterized protein n=1 Tax=Coprinellus micaceus TaxID=71717 RepID=A0A4Y7TP43_COPMI|nr:hypothetical protein FA13DRAFT_1772081 [Coprinellus micaceus]
MIAGAQDKLLKFRIPSTPRAPKLFSITNAGERNRTSLKVNYITANGSSPFGVTSRDTLAPFGERQPEQRGDFPALLEGLRPKKPCAQLGTVILARISQEQSKIRGDGNVDGNRMSGRNQNAIELWDESGGDKVA